MLEFPNGSKLMTRRNGAGYAIDWIAPNGTIRDTLECDTMQEVRAAIAVGPDRW
jgi:hypothetical protein